MAGTTNSYQKTDPKVLLAVGKSALQAQEDFGLQSLPVVDVDSPNVDDVSETSYFLPSLANNVSHRRRIYWNPGDQLPGLKQRGRVQATVSTRGRTTLIDQRTAIATTQMDSRAFLRSRYQDAQEIVPAQIADAQNQRFLDFVQTIQLDTVSGTAISFASNVDANPNTSGVQAAINKEYQTRLAPMGQFRGLFKKVCWMDQGTKRAFQKHTDYTGWAPGGVPNTPQRSLDDSTFARVFMDVHELDELHILKGIQNTANPGATASLGFVTSGILVFGLISTAMSFDLRGTEKTGAKPDGMLVYARSRDITPVSWIDEGLEVERFATRWEDGYLIPRANDSGIAMGMKFDPTTIVS